MARFYFQLDEREPTFEDHEGMEPADLDTARQVATRAARVLLHAEAEKGRPCPCCCIAMSSVTGGYADAYLSATVIDGPGR
jgi:hypothetical protein